MRKAILRLPALVVAAVAIATAPVRPDAGAAPGDVREPSVRIGITSNGVTAQFSSVGGIEVLGTDRTPVWKKVHTGDLFVVAEPPEDEPPTADRFVVQVASFSDKDNAESFAAELEQAVDEEASVMFHAASGVYRVRIGFFADEESAFRTAERLRDQGYEELWVAEDPVKLRGAAKLRLVDQTYRAHLVETTTLLLRPHRPNAPLKVNGTAYRGILEVRIDPYGRLQVINIVNIEDYLRGVVPGEMGPAVYPELEALKAQSIAARTYMVRNLGQYREVGFDICDTPRCQVYHGMDGEHPLTDRAIAETAGQILVYKGEPINALYTSTCGGHTENVEGVFIQQESAYLRGVPCYAEKMEVVRVRGDRSQPVVRLEDGRPINAELAAMRILGILQESDLDPGFLEAAAAPAETRTWIDRLLTLIGKPRAGSERSAAPLRTVRDLNRTLVDDLGWEGRIGLFFRQEDLPQLLAYGDGAELDASEKQRFAYFLHLGIFQPFPDNTLRPDHLPSRGFVLKVLHDVAASYDALRQEDEKFLGRGGGRYRIGSSLKAVEFRIAPDAYLFRQLGGRSLPAEELVLYPGDPVRYHAREDEIDWLEIRNPDRGLSDDRSSPLSRWQVRYSHEELEELLQDRFPLGTLEDIEIVETGVSGRVTQLLVRGSRGDFRIRGFRIRTALQVRETLFVLDRQYAPDGSVQDFIFTGRGWGHGVGLCQVGAYGMALRNEEYDKILRHYYTGVKIHKNYGPAFSRP